MSSMEVKEAEENVEALQNEIRELEKELKEEAAAITKRWDDALEKFEEVPIKPRK